MTPSVAFWAGPFSIETVRSRHFSSAENFWMTRALSGRRTTQYCQGRAIECGRRLPEPTILHIAVPGIPLGFAHRKEKALRRRGHGGYALGIERGQCRSFSSRAREGQKMNSIANEFASFCKSKPLPMPTFLRILLCLGVSWQLAALDYAWTGKRGTGVDQCGQLDAQWGTRTRRPGRHRCWHLDIFRTPVGASSI